MEPGPQDGPLGLSGNSYDNTMALGANTWRHVAFIEQQRDDQGLRWLVSSDVCKHWP
jgi:formate dehydrogenase iron-sulfur subunit